MCRVQVGSNKIFGEERLNKCIIIISIIIIVITY